MKRLKPEKLHVTYQPGTTPGILRNPRRYTLTHSDRTGDLFLTIGAEWDTGQISGWYTRIMRDEVLGELTDAGSGMILKIYCHVSGGLAIGTARWRYSIFQSELPLVLEAIRKGDAVLFRTREELDAARVIAVFHSKNKAYNKEEDWGKIGQYT
jgi:hypothetical protein